jgi:hypothetical protein
MNVTPELQEVVNRALNNLQQQYDAPSDYALAKRLKAIGLTTSTHILWKWRNGKWTDNDLVLIAALTQPQLVESP